MTPQYGEFPAH